MTTRRLDESLEGQDELLSQVPHLHSSICLYTCRWTIQDPIVTTRVFFQASVENVAAMWPDVVFKVNVKDYASPVTKLCTYSSSSATITMMLSCTRTCIYIRLSEYYFEPVVISTGRWRNCSCSCPGLRSVVPSCGSTMAPSCSSAGSRSSHTRDWAHKSEILKPALPSTGEALSYFL